MLFELTIRNFVIIDTLTVRFGAGFNVLTGETGAGKSIIIDAIDLILGGKARPELIRNGEEEAQLEALFDLQAAPALRMELEESGFDNGDDLLVRRILSRGGKNRIYLNGSLATAVQLQQWVSRLVAIFGQHDQLGLSRAESHGLLLDRFAGIEEEMAKYRQCFDLQRAVRAELSQLELAERERQQRLDLLTYQRHEISEAALRIGEDETLQADRLVLQHSERLAMAAESGHEALYGGESTVCERLSQMTSSLRELIKIDPGLGPLVETLDNVYYSLEDVALQLRAYAGSISCDAERLEQIEQRLATIATLKRKYGPGIAEVLQHGEKIEAEFQRLSDLERVREGLTRQFDLLSEQLAEIGRRITSSRASAAIKLGTAVEDELRDLAMAKAHFEARLIRLPEAGSRGFEKIEFYLQANPGEEARPLARVASGGELSRLMLAIKRVVPVNDEMTTLIFDEVDSGIGGAAATAVGEKLRAVADGRQVLCITHLPQVAAFARQQYQVRKEETSDGRTRVALTPLSDNDRAAEIARMLGGARITEQSLLHARELISLSSDNRG